MVCGCRCWRGSVLCEDGQNRGFAVVSGGRCCWGLRDARAPPPGAERMGLSGAWSVQRVWKGVRVRVRVTLHCIALLALHCTALLCFHCIALRCIALHCIVLYCIALLCFVLHCIALDFIALHCTTLYCTALHCFHCIALHCVAFHSVAFGLGLNLGLGSHYIALH